MLCELGHKMSHCPPMSQCPHHLCKYFIPLRNVESQPREGLTGSQPRKWTAVLSHNEIEVGTEQPKYSLLELSS